ncbi:MAG: 23S rRNA (cytidine(2498)-2'-O)-methyltransferase RlmM, partial [Marinobacter sp. 34-60-7]
MQQIMLMCRPGFENEAGQELTDTAAAAGVFGYFQPERDQGRAWFTLAGNASAEDLMARVPLSTLVFVRDWFMVTGICELPAQDRVGAMLEFLRSEAWPGNLCARVEVRLVETNSDHDLGNFARKWVAPLSRALRGAGLLLTDADAPAVGQLEILLTGFDRAVVGVSLAR